MTKQELESQTVLQLRKIAKENGVKLRAGIDKAGIVALLLAGLPQEEAPAFQAAVEPAPRQTAPVQEQVRINRDEIHQEVQPPVQRTAPAEVQQPAQDQPVFRAAWSRPAAQPRFNTAPAYSNQNRPSYNNNRGQQSRPGVREPQPTRTVSRFGPGAAEPAPRQENRGYRGFGPQSIPIQPRQEQPYQEREQEYPVSRSYEPEAPVPQHRYAELSSGYRSSAGENGLAPTAADLLATVECKDGSGILEIHPDGYGFLRQDTFLPSSRDIYISIAQIRRFGLRNGDKITGKVRPQRDSDKFAAMLVISTINGKTPEAAAARPMFEDLTPIYPTRRIDLDTHDGKKLNDMRLVDLMAPLGFGQRALILCPPGTGKTRMLQHFASTIHTNYPGIKILTLLVNENPEDVTVFQDAVGKCPVVACTFDQPPENQLRICDLVLERALRLTEQGLDVVLIVDSLTTLAKISSQQARSTTGMVNPTSLMRAKRIFGAARCIRQGGSLTVIAAMNVDTTNRVDDAIAEEFKDTANMEIRLDPHLEELGIDPPMDLINCSTRNGDVLLNEEEKEGLQLTRKILGDTPSEKAVPEMISMMNTVDSNATFLKRIKEWAALMD